jgi:hypothetical protein
MSLIFTIIWVLRLDLALNSVIIVAMLEVGTPKSRTVKTDHYLDICLSREVYRVCLSLSKRAHQLGPKDSIYRDGQESKTLVVAVYIRHYPSLKENPVGVWLDRLCLAAANDSS